MDNTEDHRFSSIEDLICRVRDQESKWRQEQPSSTLANGRIIPAQGSAWFRGHGRRDWKLTPRVFRDYAEGEIGLVHEFRNRALAIGSQSLPFEDEYFWLLLMQHVGLPTRLLDWTENPLVALFFAIWDLPTLCGPTIWMLNPYRLNLLVLGESMFLDPKYDERARFRVELAFRDLIAAQTRAGSRHWQDHQMAPIAISPAHVHARLRAQQGRFTLHGTCREDLRVCLAESGVQVREDDILVRFELQATKYSRRELLDQLGRLGVSTDTLFTDLVGLANELSHRWRPQNERFCVVVTPAEEGWRADCPAFGVSIEKARTEHEATKQICDVLEDWCRERHRELLKLSEQRKQETWYEARPKSSR